MAKTDLEPTFQKPISYKNGIISTNEGRICKLCLFSVCCFPFTLSPLTAGFTSEQLLGLSVFFLKRLLIYLCSTCSYKKIQNYKREENKIACGHNGVGVTKRNIFKGVLLDLFKKLESCVGVSFCIEHGCELCTDGIVWQRMHKSLGLTFSRLEVK